MILKQKRILRRIRFLFFHPFLCFEFLKSERKNFSDIGFSEIKQFLKDASIIVEAGASDGIDTEQLLSNFSHAQIYALEPVPQQAEFLRKKFDISTNSKYSRVKIFEIALGVINGEVDLLVGNSGNKLDGMGSSSLLKPKNHLHIFPEINFEKKIIVKSLKLMEFCQQYIPGQVIDFLRLDLQGMEYFIIKDSALFIKNQVKFLQIEASRIELFDGSKVFKDLDHILKNLGFKLIYNRVGAITGNAFYENSRQNFGNTYRD